MSLIMTDLHPIAILMAERLLGCLLAGSILALCAWAALRLMGRHNSRTRFAVCFATLIAIAAVPFVGFIRSAHVASASSGSAALHLPATWAIYIFAAWALAAGVALLRVAYGICQLERLRRSCVPIAASTVEPRLLHTLEELQAQRPVELCTSKMVRVPTALGLRKPAVVLPEWCLRELSPDEVHSIVLHEAEHLRRFDDWTNLLQRLVGAVFFFHPAVWWLERRLSLEREMACDDAVLAQGNDPKAYARCLVSLAEKSYVRRGLALTQAAVSRVQQLSARVAQILDAKQPRTTHLWKPAFWMVAIGSLAGGASMNVMGRLVAFQSDLPIVARRAPDTMPVATSNSVPARAQNESSERVIPARFNEPSLPVHPVANPGAHKFGAATKSVVGTNAVVATNSPAPVEPSARQPVQLGAIFEQEPTSAPAAMLVMVVHTEQTDEAGTVFWSVRVVRWMVFHPQPNRVTDPAGPAKT